MSIFQLFTGLLGFNTLPKVNIPINTRKNGNNVNKNTTKNASKNTTNVINTTNKTNKNMMGRQNTSRSNNASQQMNMPLLPLKNKSNNIKIIVFHIIQLLICYIFILLFLVLILCFISIISRVINTASLHNHRTIIETPTMPLEALQILS